jgi:predicted RNase H-like nuclease (RuvC/YqgF family)
MLGKKPIVLLGMGLAPLAPGSEVCPRIKQRGRGLPRAVRGRLQQRRTWMVRPKPQTEEATDSATTTLLDLLQRRKVASDRLTRENAYLRAEVARLTTENADLRAHLARSRGEMGF